MKKVYPKIKWHDSYMVCEHNYICGVCHKNSAVFQVNTGIFQPCWDCQNKGYIVKKSAIEIIRIKLQGIVFRLLASSGRGSTPVTK